MALERESRFLADPLVSKAPGPRLINPAALLDSGQSFNALWAEATCGSNNEIELIPLLKINGTWDADYSRLPYPRYS